MVGIIPKRIEKASRWQNLFFYLALGLLIAVILGYAVLFYFEGKNSRNLQDIEYKIIQIGAEEDKVREEEISSVKNKINDFSSLFNNYKKTSNLFNFLEEICHPKIWLTRLELDSNMDQVLISGQSSNFKILGQQLLIMQEQDLIQRISLNNLSVNEEGNTDFYFQLFLNPKIFQ